MRHPRTSYGGRRLKTGVPAGRGKILRRPALGAALLVVALVAAACGSGGGGETASPLGDAPAGTAERTGTTVAQVPGGPREDVPSALAAPAGPGLPTPTVAIGRLLPGGPPPDGIPPIDEPRFLPAADVEFLRDSEPVLAFGWEVRPASTPCR